MESAGGRRGANAGAGAVQHGQNPERLSVGQAARSRLVGAPTLQNPGQRELGDSCESKLQIPDFDSPLSYSKFLREFSLAQGDTFAGPTSDDGLAAFLNTPSVSIGQSLTLKIQSATEEWVLVEVLRMDGTKTGASEVCSFQVKAGIQPPERWVAYGGQRYVSFADWSVSATINVSDRHQWLSGSYAVRITNALGKTKLLPFVVEDQTLPAKVLVVMPSLTQPVAYNYALGGRDTSASAYKGWDGTAYVQSKRARAFAVQQPLDNNSSWTYLANIQGAVQYLERNGIPVAYTTDLGLWRHPELAVAYSTLIFPFHPEYIPPAVYAAVEKAIASGVHIVSWFSNGFYWKVEIGETSDGDTVLTINKDGDRDLWRRQHDGTGQLMSEQRLFGAKYPNRKGAWGGPITPLIIAPRSSSASEPSAKLLEHWIFANAGFQLNDQVDGAMGGEVDVIEAGSPFPPAQETIVLLSPYANSGGSTYAAATQFFTRPSGQMTFHAGSQVFSSALAASGPNQKKLQRMMNNILVRMIGVEHVHAP